MHDHFELDRAAQTKRIVTAMQDPAVRMIGHLSARMIGGRPPIELDIDAIVDAAEKTNTALEVNGALPRLDMSVDALRHARSRRGQLRLDQRCAPGGRARSGAMGQAQCRARIGSTPTAWQTPGRPENSSLGPPLRLGIPQDRSSRAMVHLCAHGYTVSWPLVRCTADNLGISLKVWLA